MAIVAREADMIHFILLGCRKRFKKRKRGFAQQCLLFLFVRGETEVLSDTGKNGIENGLMFI